MKSWSLVKKSLRFYWRTHLGVVLGVAVSTAVLVGALVVGDSVKYTLRKLALSRLGKVQLALASSSRYFRAALADELRPALDNAIAPVLQLRGIATSGDGAARVNNAQVLGIDQQQIDDRFPIQEVSTGIFTIIVPLRSLSAIKNIKIDKDRYFKLVENTTAKLILAFCPETYHKPNDLNVRVFGDYYGVPEDPATGSANGCLAGYLVKHRYFGSNQIDIRVEQGYEIDRPSLLSLKAWDQNGIIDMTELTALAQEWLLSDSPD